MDRRQVLLGAISVLSAGRADAQSNPMRDGFFPKNAPAPQAVLYETPVAQVRFVLDRSNPRQPLLRFEGENEIWALSVVRGPRGDDILKTDTDETLLRITALGGVTLYGPEGELGAPAAVVSRARPFTSPNGGDGSLAAVQARVIGAARRGLDRRVIVEAPERLPVAFLSDAARRVEDGLEATARGPRRRGLLRLRAVRFEQARESFAAFDGALLRVGLAPSLSYAGRPSSKAVRAALEAARRS
jgi:hypothetical protein